MQSGGHRSMPGAWLFQKALMRREAIDKGSSQVESCPGVMGYGADGVMLAYTSVLVEHDAGTGRSEEVFEALSCPRLMLQGLRMSCLIVAIPSMRGQ